MISGYFPLMTDAIDKNSSQQINEAARRLSSGEVVAIPTETVYGLAAAINQPAAIERVFLLKERPFFDPLIIHVSDKSQLETIAKEIPATARRLADRFWPGPLTLVLPRKSEINPMICAGLDTVGVRCPAHPMTLEIIRKTGVPLAAPSANKFTKTSATTAAHVRGIWGPDELFVVDGGPCEIGIESTVVRVNDSPARIEILRPGMIGEIELRAAAPEAAIGYVATGASPGNTPEHYQPAIPLVLIPAESFPPDTSRLQEICSRLGVESPHYSVLDLGERPAIAARKLYSELHRLSESEAALLFYVRTPETLGGEWRAIQDRLKRAASLDLTGGQSAPDE